MPGNFKGMKKTGKWLRHCCASFPSRRSIVVRGATSTAANLGARVSRVKRAFAMTKALKSGQLALTRAECQYFSLHPLNGKISFPSFGKPVVQMKDRKSVVLGKGVSVRLDLVGSGDIKKKK